MKFIISLLLILIASIAYAKFDFSFEVGSGSSTVSGPVANAFMVTDGGGEAFRVTDNGGEDYNVQ